MNKLPDFFLVGSSKAGTTSMCTAFLNHPEIKFSRKKEPNFFSSFDPSLTKIPSDQLSEYEKLFDDKTCEDNKDHKLLGEGSVRYLTSENALYWIKRYIPSAKIIIILRNPIERIVSLYQMYKRLDNINMSREEMISENSYLIKQCLLYDYIISYINNFSREQVYIMVYDDFARKPQDELNNLYKFLGVAEKSHLIIKHQNKGGIPRSKLFGVLTNRQLITTVKRIFPTLLHTPIDNLIKYIFFENIELTLNEKKRLVKIFESDVNSIGKLINRNLYQEWFGVLSSDGDRVR